MAYALGIYLLNLFLAFLQPKFDPSNEAMDNEMEDGSVGTLPTKQDEEFKPFVRRLPEFKFWYWATRAVVISFACSWFEIFNVPVFWPVLVMYWIILFVLTSKFEVLYHLCCSCLTFSSAKANPAYDQVPIRPLHCGQEELCQEQLVKSLGGPMESKPDIILQGLGVDVFCMTIWVSFIKRPRNALVARDCCQWECIASLGREKGLQG